MPPNDSSPLISDKTQPTQSLWGGFKILVKSPIRVWIVFLIAGLYTFCLFLAGIVVELFMGDEFGASDIEVGMVYCGIGFMSTLATIAEGALPDRLGVRLCSILAGALLALALAIMASAPTRWVGELAALTILPMGVGLIPVTKVAIKRYTGPTERSTAYSVLYLFMSGVPAFASLLVDMVSTAIQEGTWAYRISLFIGVGIALLTCILAYFLKEDQLQQPQSEISYWESWAQVARLESCRLVLLVVLALVFVKAGYRQLDASLPRYMRRELGPTAHFGVVMMAHPIVLVVSALFLTPLVLCVKLFWIILAGAIISALSSFILLSGCFYWSVTLYVVVITIGESLWNPRMYDYAVSKAPERLEGVFMALATLPLFLSMMPAGMMAALLLPAFCPDANSHCYAMWAVVGSVSLISPIALIVIHKRLKT